MRFLHREIDTKKHFSNFSQFEYHVIDIRMRRLRIDLSLIFSLCNNFEGSTKCDNRAAMILSNIFLKQFSNIIIRYALDYK